MLIIFFNNYLVCFWFINTNFLTLVKLYSVHKYKLLFKNPTFNDDIYIFKSFLQYRKKLFICNTYKNKIQIL